MKGYKVIAEERMQILFESALSDAKNNPRMAQHNAMILRRISSKYRLPLPHHIRRSFCKKCKMFIVPGIGSKVRINRSNVCTTCTYCGHVYRKISKKQVVFEILWIFFVHVIMCIASAKECSKKEKRKILIF